MSLGARILLADDDPNFQKVMEYNLSQAGAELSIVGNGEEAWRRLGEAEFDLLLSDVRMPGLDGLELLSRARATRPSLPVILITAHGDIEMAVEAMQRGASDFITKPFDRHSLLEKVERALRPSRLARENEALREQLADRFSFEKIIGSSEPMRRLFDVMTRVAFRDTTVLIRGESGTGKELVARALHQASPRREGRFVAVNCAAIPPALLESELFGHLRGSFTGADSDREGRFQAASGGTLFLDEIGDMPLELQAKLLRSLQERQVEPVGSSKPVPIDVRILAATHQDLEQLVESGSFRRDLYFRLNVVPLTVPPLRERLEDIPLLARHFLRRLGEPEVKLEPSALECLRRYSWPGNVRELENMVERALALRIDPERLTDADFILPEPCSAPLSANGSLQLPEGGIVLDQLERDLIRAALHKAQGNQTRAAALLGISRQKLIYRMQKHEVD